MCHSPQKKDRIRYCLNRFFNNWWVNFILGFLALVIIALLMFDAVMIGVLGQSMIFDLPK